MAQLAIPLLVASTAMTAYGESQKGAAAEVAARSTAEQQVRNAKASEAEGIRQSIETRRKGAQVASDAAAIMGASGGVTDDVGAIKTLADIEQVTDYNALAALYQGGQRADQQRFAADLDRLSGHQARKAGNVRAGATVLGGASKAYTLSKI